ncbi:multidrug effflux MFS transporter [Oerskovia sp. KBS0722]|nr:multidrug effflux MFS transporter [Oerskovia sp. KBS0722]
MATPPPASSTTDAVSRQAAPSATSASAPTRATRITVGFVLLLSALTAIGPLTIDLYLSAFPQIVTDLGTTESRIQLTLTATLAGLALGQLLIGSLSDAVGRRLPLLSALSIYVLASVGIVFVQSIEMLTVLRFVQGLTAAAGMVLSMAIVRDNFEGFLVGKVIARLMLVVGVAPILAPTIGAQFLRMGSWRLMFVALAVFGVLLLVLAALRLKESLPPARRRTGGTVAALRSYGSLVRDWSFFGLALLGGFYMAAMFTYISASTFVFQEQFGLSAQQYAIIFGAGAVSVTIGSQVNGALVGRVTPEQILRVIVPVGILLSAALFAATLSGAGLPVIVALIVLTLGTAGFVMPSVPAVALERNAHRAGSAAALLGAMQFGVGAGIAPLTGLIGGDVTITMAAVMFGVISVAGLLLLSLTRSLRAAPVEGTVDEPVLVSDASELGVVAAAEAVVEAAEAATPVTRRA